MLAIAALVIALLLIRQPPQQPVDSSSSAAEKPVVITVVPPRPPADETPAQIPKRATATVETHHVSAAAPASSAGYTRVTLRRRPAPRVARRSTPRVDADAILSGAVQARPARRARPVKRAVGVDGSHGDTDADEQDRDDELAIIRDAF